jgi:hypothetical protein
VTEAPPTADQLKNILEYLGGPTSATVGKIVRGANDQSDALKRLEKDGDAFQRPVVRFHIISDIVCPHADCNRSSTGISAKQVSLTTHTLFTTLTHAVAGDNESEILSLLNSTPKEDGKS